MALEAEDQRSVWVGPGVYGLDTGEGQGLLCLGVYDLAWR